MNEQMRETLKAARVYIIEHGRLNDDCTDIFKQIDDALKSEPTTSELVAELRKREGVKTKKLIFDTIRNEKIYTLSVSVPDKPEKLRGD